MMSAFIAVRCCSVSAKLSGRGWRSISSAYQARFLTIKFKSGCACWRTASKWPKSRMRSKRVLPMKAMRFLSFSFRGSLDETGSADWGLSALDANIAYFCKSSSYEWRLMERKYTSSPKKETPLLVNVGKILVFINFISFFYSSYLVKFGHAEDLFTNLFHSIGS